ncbi:MAG TPA: TetR/AcrR family transcriptional regulator [Candidatus Binataceae bacterium]|jgi:AcrR family transcriptional regulator|nr:TetR/AcrR family transcriptional regulator [Candidatus Binataceae bacterium]
MVQTAQKPAITSRERRTAQKAALRREIMDAAAELFGTEGYENVSMRKIAQRIGYTPMAIYLYFKDKNELLDCICEEAFTQLYRSLERLKESYKDPIEVLHATIKGFIDFAVKHPHHYRATFLAPARAKGSMPRRDAVRLRTRELLRELVANFMGPRASAEEIEVATQIVIIAGNGFSALTVANPDFPWSPRAKVIEGLVKTIAGGLKR